MHDQEEGDLSIVNEARQTSCKGKEFLVPSPESASFYRNYPFHRHFTSNENYKLSYQINILYDPDKKQNKMVTHSLFCTGELIDHDRECNKMCSDVIDTRSFRNMLKLSQEESPDASTPIELLTYGQLQVNYRELKAKLDSEKLENLNLKRRNVTANKRATLNDRFMNTIASNDIPRLHILLQVCKDKGMGMRSILGRIDDAINHKYKPEKYGEEDWDKALLVLRIGGPKLFNLLQVTDGYPSLRGVQSKSSKEGPTKLISGVDASFESRLEVNTNGCQQGGGNITSLKMDKIATEERLRWNIQDNKIYGLCFEHACSYSMDFNQISDVEQLKDLLQSRTIHKTKQNLVVAVGNVGYGGDIKPILTLPTCSKSVNPQFEKMLEAVIKKLSLDIVATDGDSSRRRFFNGRMKLVKDNEMKCFLKQLELFDLNFVDGDKTLYFDDKHNFKRMQTLVISDKRGTKISGTVLAKDQLKYVTEKAIIQKISSMLDPIDRQNVPLVLRLYGALDNCSEFCKSSSDTVCQASFITFVMA